MKKNIGPQLALILTFGMLTACAACAHVDDTSGWADTLGSGNVSVTFSAMG